jgi:hypothetical protein
MNQKEIIEKLFECNGMSLRQYTQELVSQVEDDLFQNVGINYGILETVVKVVFEDATQYIKECAKEEK